MTHFSNNSVNKPFNHIDQNGRRYSDSDINTSNSSVSLFTNLMALMKSKQEV